MWQVLILTSKFTFSSKVLLHHIDDTTGLREKVVVATLNICDLEAVFPLTDIYATQII